MWRIAVLSLLVLTTIFLPIMGAAHFKHHHLGGIPAPSGPVGLLTPDRDASANWQKAGLLSIGGIPNRATVCGSTITPRGGGLDDSVNINNAISACPAGDVVSLASGTFTIAEGNTVSINKGVTVRGAGPGVTILAHPTSTTANCGTGPGGNNPSPYGAIQNCQTPGQSPSAVVVLGGVANILNTTNVSANAAAGSTTITVVNASSIAPGTLIQIDELALGQAMADCCFNGGTGHVWAEPNYRVEWNAHNPTVGSWDSADYSNAFTSGDACNYSLRCGGVTTELHLVQSVSGTTITLDSPLTLPYRTANTAQVNAYDPTTIVQQAGLENLSVRNGDQGNVGFFGCVYCWVKTVESNNWLNNGGFYFYYAAFRDQLDTFWVHNAAWPVYGGGGYAINLTFGASEDYIVNGIDMLANKVDVVRASGSGTVFAYNYMDDQYINLGGNADGGWVETGMNCSHLAGSHHVLFEGNQASNSDSDFTHGSSGHCTYFRNYITGIRETFTALDGTVVNDTLGNFPMRAISDHPYSYWDSFVGNVLGKPGVTTAANGWVYRDNSFGGSPPTIFKLGWSDFSGAGGLPDQTLALDYPTHPTGANLTITGPGCDTDPSYCVPIRDGNYDYLTNSIQWASNDTAHVLPNSLYLSGAPSFFTGGSSTWPPVDPINGVVHNIPAHARWAACQPPLPSCMFTQP